MKYKMEELVPIVGKLAEKYTAFESTSLPYEKARQLMEAVLYCIHEVELQEENAVIPAEGMSAQQAYETGAEYVKEKTKKALNLYNEILSGFTDYDNRCLQDTFAKGLPEFFKWYDIQFEPQNTILTLDYPVLKDLSGYTGIDRIYKFIVCIGLEQKFLKIFPESYVINLLSGYNREYKDMLDNLCEIVFTAVIQHILAGKPLDEPEYKEEDCLYIERILKETEIPDLKVKLEKSVKIFVQKHCGEDGELLEYLAGAMDDIIVRLKNAAENGTLHQYLIETYI